MMSRIVTVTLAVAMGLLNGVALSQTEAPLQDPLPPISTFGELPQSRLPLGELSPEIQESIARQPPPDRSPIERGSARLYAIRRWVSRAPRSGIALAGGVLCAALAAGWAFGSASRRRAYRRQPRSAGGPRLRGLEEVVASVQFAHSRSRGGPPGSEWPDQP